MKEYLKTINARLQLADKALNKDMLGLGLSIHKDVINDLISMIETLYTNIEAMKEIMKGE